MPAPINLYMDPSTNDLLVEDYNLRLTSDNVEALSQKLQFKLRVVQGEWFLDYTAGIPYFQDILKKQVDLNKINALFLAAIADTPGVSEIQSFAADLDTATRTYSADFTVRADSGETVSGSVII